MYQQPAVGHSLNDEPRQRTDQDGEGKGQPNGQSRRRHGQVDHIAAHHDDVAMGKVYQLYDAVHHAVSQCHQRVYTAQSQAV